jgi:hypothetical protein
MPRWLVITSGIATLGVILGSSIFHEWRMKQLMRRHGLHCPHCRASFYGGMGHLAVASGRCGTCGEVVLHSQSLPNADDESLPAKGENCPKN